MLFVGRDLNATARLRSAAESLGWELVISSPESYPRVIADLAPQVVVVDLDEVGVEGISAMHPPPHAAEVIGFYSHVRDELHQAASAKGWAVFPRGRFWRESHAILEEHGPTVD